MNTISQRQKEKFYAEGRTLPKCINVGCGKDVAVREWKNWSFKSECSSCQTARKKGKVREGITIHKKNYCENIDGHLGFKCPIPSKESWNGFYESLDLDHIDGNHENNIIDNVKTYCKLCHGRKSINSGDCSSFKKSARKFNI